MVTATGGPVPHHAMADCPHWTYSLSPVVGGFRHHMQSASIHGWLRARAAQAETVTAVCTGSLLLSAAGFLDGLEATTHWRFLDTMRDSFPAVNVQYDKHFVQDGRVFTSAGISAGIDMSLKVVENYFGENIARETAHHWSIRIPMLTSSHSALRRHASSNGEAEAVVAPTREGLLRDPCRRRDLQRRLAILSTAACKPSRTDQFEQRG